MLLQNSQCYEITVCTQTLKRRTTNGLTAVITIHKFIVFQPSRALICTILFSAQYYLVHNTILTRI